MDYRAFVSYAHEDKVWAAWMHKALERYRVPKRLRADVGTTTLRPIFRDKDELGYSGDLSATLIDALARSQSLIVVCSPHGARSFWVDQEVRTFKRLQPGRPILCALVDGDGGDPSSVFPPALLHELTDDGELGDRLPEPLAVDFRAAADGKRDGLLKLVAGILNLRFDELKMRERQWRRQRQVSLTAAAATLAFAVGIGTYYFSRAPDCLDQPGLYSELWSPDHRNRVQVAFAETGLPYAERVWRTIDDLLDQYATAWSSVHVEACEATYERKEQSVQLLDRRMMCLTDRRRNFVALREEFANAKLATLEHAVASASTLRDLTRCSDMEALLAAFPPPDNSAVAEAVNILKTDLVRTRAALMSGKVEGIMEAATDHANRAADTAYPPIEADALLLLAQSHLAIGEWKTAKNILYQSAARAVVGKEGELAAAAWLELPSILARNQADFREAFNMLQLAESYVTSLPETHPLQGRYLSERGQVLSYSGRYEEGIALLGQSVTFARQYDVMHLPGYLHALAWSLVGDFRTEEAIEVSDEALVLAEQIYGRLHPIFAESLDEQSRVHARQGNFAHAIELLHEALAINRAVYGEYHQKIAINLESLAWRLKELGNVDEARSSLDESLRIQEQLDTPQWSTYGSTHNTYADLFMDSGDFTRARHHLEKALEIWSVAGESHPNVSIALNNLGNLSNREGRFQDAQLRCEQAVSIDADRHGDDFPGLAYPLSCLGEAYLGLGESLQAVHVLERAHRFRDDSDVDPLRLAWSRWLLGRALWESGTDRIRGREYVMFAHDQFSKHADAATSELADVVKWLRDNAEDK